MRAFIIIMYFILFASIVHSQDKSEIKLKTNAKDMLTINEMISTEDGLGDGYRTYKIIGRKYAYGEALLDVLPEIELTGM